MPHNFILPAKMSGLAPGLGLFQYYFGLLITCPKFSTVVNFAVK